MDLDLNRCRPLDVHRWSEYLEVDSFISSIYLILEAGSPLSRTDKRIIKVVILDLYVCWKTDPQMVLRYSRDNNAYKSKSRYNSLKIGKKLISIIDQLIADGIVQHTKGFMDRTSGSAFQSRLWPSDSLISLFQEATFDSLAIEDHKDREVIILRDESKADIAYDDTEPSERSRVVLHQYNEILNRTHIDIHTLDDPFLVLGEGRDQRTLTLGQHDKFVRRIFNNSSFDQGGRFYGGWWQRCPKELREFIFIEGCYTSEIDYSGIHLILMYAKKDINYWQEVGTDPYQIPSPSWWPETINLRAVAKQLLLIAINASDRATAFKAFRAEAAVGTDEKKMTNQQLGELLESLVQKHHIVADQLASGVGIFLMNTEAAITEKIIEHFIVLGVPILTIHDSYIVPLGYEYELINIMERAFTEVTGLSDPKFESIRNLPHQVAQSSEDYEPPITTERHIRSLAEFRLFHDLPDRPLWYEEAVAQLHNRGIVELI